MNHALTLCRMMRRSATNAASNTSVNYCYFFQKINSKPINTCQCQLHLPNQTRRCRLCSLRNTNNYHIFAVQQNKTKLRMREGREAERKLSLSKYASSRSACCNSASSIANRSSPSMHMYQTQIQSI